MTREECIKETIKHIERVDELLTGVMNVLGERGRTHDLSKLQSPELEIFMEYTPKLKNSTYGSDEYKEFLKQMKPALDHHYSVSQHHPEMHPNGIKDMSLIDIMEMLCDWKAASERHDNGDIMRSIEVNKDRFNMSEDLTQILKNTAKLL